MRVLLTWILVLLPLSFSFAASEETPTQFRGLWGTTDKMCDFLLTGGPLDESGPRDPGGNDPRWLKILAKNVLGSRQGRFLREVPSKNPSGAAGATSFEMQALDERGSIVRLTLSADGWLQETMFGARGGDVAKYHRC